MLVAAAVSHAAQVFVVSTMRQYGRIPLKAGRTISDLAAFCVGFASALTRRFQPADVR
jgi:hypothetical protein